jgi:hypothetical protein
MKQILVQEFVEVSEGHYDCHFNSHLEGALELFDKEYEKKWWNTRI